MLCCWLAAGDEQAYEEQHDAARRPRLRRRLALVAWLAHSVISRQSLVAMRPASSSTTSSSQQQQRRSSRPGVYVNPPFHPRARSRIIITRLLSLLVAWLQQPLSIPLSRCRLASLRRPLPALSDSSQAAAAAR